MLVTLNLKLQPFLLSESQDEEQWLFTGSLQIGCCSHDCETSVDTSVHFCVCKYSYDD